MTLFNNSKSTYWCCLVNTISPPTRPNWHVEASFSLTLTILLFFDAVIVIFLDLETLFRNTISWLGSTFLTFFASCLSQYNENKNT